ncbi:adhesion G protein-coupled receptor F4 [Cololabis saira]|uniref:adhesion G protein-coupled receptor F4 n=1 Tax=Cololabis saira TaxID=129043 RepID=UPI002AD31F71|nr:adhesion G protein-coupled receptor F4 [Cololabis saira]
MWSRVFIVLIGAVCIYQVITADIYIGEVMVESNVTLDANTILESWPPGLQLTLANAQSVTLQDIDVVAECVIIGPAYTCNCSAGYVWTNEVCYTYGCCSETTCEHNVSLISPVCIRADHVFLNGSIQLSSSWSSANTDHLRLTLETLNGVKSLNITESSEIGDFRLDATVRFNTSKLHEIVAKLETDLTPKAIAFDTYGMVNITNLTGMVKYDSEQNLKCTFEEATDQAGWNISKEFERLELNNGDQVVLDLKCADPVSKSCVGVTLKKVTGIWAGMYECGFTTGSVRHTARTRLDVAPLPDTITLAIEPLVADCLDGSSEVVKVTATIPNNTAKYEVRWTSSEKETPETTETAKGQFSFTYDSSVSCEKTEEPHRVYITVLNNMNQRKTAEVDIPVIYAGESFCEEETLNGDIWPKSPAGATVINRTCAEGRVGYKSRTCDKPGTWQDVFSNCVNEELSKISDAAENFLDGMGATEEVAKNIFEGMKNNTQSSSNSSDDLADINASVGIFSIMADASKNIVLEEGVFPGLVDAASNVLNSTWRRANDSVRYNMSSKYLLSVENLVKNIRTNTSEGFNSSNLELRFCTHADCNVTAFDIGINLNMTKGTLKVTAVKNIMDKLKNGFRGTERTDLLVSATLVNNSDSGIGINLAFPDGQQLSNQRFCVFWDTTLEDWSDTGCTLNTTKNNQTICECNHLTSFSILMSKGEISDKASSKILDIITNVGLAVSITCLLIFLIIESLVWSAVIKTNLSHFRHTAVVNIAVFRLLADCSFLASTNPKILPDSWCLVLTVSKHVFYLAMFTWMLCLSVLLVHQLIFVFSPLRKRVFMFLSSILGYVLPILLVGASYVYYKYTQKDYYNRNTCWLVYESLLVGSIHAFILPVGTIILANLFSMVVVIFTLMKTSVPDSSKTDEKEMAKSILKVVVFLTPVFGVTWAIGFFLQILDEDNKMYYFALYSFTILNSLQGLFILLTGCIAEQKVREELIKMIRKKSGDKSDSMTKGTSTTDYKSK